jgi:hypothetical protein
MLVTEESPLKERRRDLQPFYYWLLHRLVLEVSNTAASYAPKVGNCELRITEKRFTKVPIV